MAVATGSLPVTGVSFYTNMAWCATLTAPPYSIQLSGFPLGTYSVYAVATNSLGETAFSATNTFAAWTDSRRRARWLVDVKLTVHKAVAPKFVGLRCEDDGTDIAVVITAKGRTRCVVAVKHTRLASAQLVAERRHCWKEMLRNLAHSVAERA